MEITALNLPGSFELHPHVFRDERGKFIKTYHRDLFESLGLATDFREQYYSVSHRNVLRGLHFQSPPDDQDKVVACLQGRILDVGVDLRRGSPTFGQHFSIELSAAKGNMVYLPKGIAHGFVTISDEAIVNYNVTSVYSPASDCGIHWSSAGIRWPTKAPVISSRDQAFQPLDRFVSPFKWNGTQAA